MTPTPEDIAREAPLERVTRWLHHESCGLLPSFEWPGPGVCACKATVAALISEAIRSAVQAEREAIAKMFEDEQLGGSLVGRYIAASIRSRGDK